MAFVAFLNGATVVVRSYGASAVIVASTADGRRRVYAPEERVTLVE